LLLAHLFGLTCLVQSGMLFRRASVSWSTTVPVSNKDDFVAVVSQLLSIGERKTWISEGAWWSLCEALVGLCESHLPWKEEALSASLNILLAQHQKWSPEKVALVIKLQPLCPNQPWADLLQPTFKKGSILSEKNRTSLAAIICVCPASLCSISPHLVVQEVTSPGDSYLAALDGPWKRPLHFVWQSIIDLCLNGGKGPVNQPSTFIHIWKEIVSGAVQIRCCPKSA
jgi:DNA polymerase phi